MQNRIQELREEQRMTQVRLSIELGVSQETVSAYENGRHYPSVTMLIKLSKLFDASCDYILGLSDVRQLYGVHTLDAATQKLLAQYQRLDERKRERLAAYLDGLSE